LIFFLQIYDIFCFVNFYIIKTGQPHQNKPDFYLIHQQNNMSNLKLPFIDGTPKTHHSLFQLKGDRTPASFILN